jgi:hypothetical protein
MRHLHPTARTCYTHVAKPLVCCIPRLPLGPQNGLWGGVGPTSPTPGPAKREGPAHYIYRILSTTLAHSQHPSSDSRRFPEVLSPPFGPARLHHIRWRSNLRQLSFGGLTTTAIELQQVNNPFPLMPQSLLTWFVLGSCLRLFVSH